MADPCGIDAVLFGYENQENLGLRSLVAYLDARGRRALLLPFRGSLDEEALALVRRFRPRVVGYSLIFQHAIDEFGGLMKYLRSNGVDSHFTAGGHFPSLRPEETMEFLPELDSIVRFEGEETLHELLAFLGEPGLWSSIRGLAFRRGSEVVLNDPRPLVPDLDSLPPVHRDKPGLAADGIPWRQCWPVAAASTTARSAAFGNSTAARPVREEGCVPLRLW